MRRSAASPWSARRGRARFPRNRRGGTGCFAADDTVSDLCRYLTDREQFFRSGRAIFAAGEEELVAYYLRGYSEEKERHYFDVCDEDPSMPTSRSTMLSVTEGYWAAWK